MNIRCYDNCGKTADRYTVVFMDRPTGRGAFEALGMNSQPFHGIGMHTTAMPGRHLGVRIAFEQLPADYQRAVQQDLEVVCQP